MKKTKFLIVLCFVSGCIIGGFLIWRLADKAICEQSKSLNRAKSYYELLNQWVKLKIEGKKLEKYFVDNSYKTIAIYGYAELGHRLYDELKDSKETKIKYIIDQNKDDLYENIDIYKPEDILPQVDVIVITPIFAYAEIERNLIERIDYKIVSLSDVIAEM